MAILESYSMEPLISSLNGVILKNYDVKGLHGTEEVCV